MRSSAIYRYHHPHLQSVSGDGGNYPFKFDPFAGTEDKPCLPAEVHSDPRLTVEDRTLLHLEYVEARILWGTVVFHQRVKFLVNRLDTQWREHQRAVSDMRVAFTDVCSSRENCGSLVLHLVELHEAAIRTACSWDGCANSLMEVYLDYVRNVGKVTSKDLPTLLSSYKGSKDWEFGSPEDYDFLSWGNDFGPQERKVLEEIDNHREFIRNESLEGLSS